MELFWISFLGLVALIQLIYYLYFFTALPSYKLPKQTDSEEGVSVILCAKNEKENLNTAIQEMANNRNRMQQELSASRERLGNIAGNFDIVFR